MSTQIQIASSGGVPSGFKYNIQPVFYGTGSNTPVPTAGQAVFAYQYDGDGGYYELGWFINNIDAEGNNITYYLLELGGQPFTINTASGKSIWANTSYTDTNAILQSGSIYLIQYPNFSNVAGLSLVQLENQVGYFNFGTSIIPPVYTGYTLNGNLNGSSINVGVSYIGIGSSTSSASATARSFFVNTPQQKVRQAYITTAGVMTGSMSIKLLAAGSVQIGTTYTIPAGSAAGSYAFINSSLLNAPYSTGTMVIEITQTVATSCGIQYFALWVA